MSVRSPLNITLLRKLHAVICIQGHLLADDVTRLIEAAQAAGYKAQAEAMAAAFCSGALNSLELILLSEGGLEAGILHLSGKAGAVHQIALSQVVARVDSLEQAVSESLSVRQQLSYAIGNPSLCFDASAQFVSLVSRGKQKGLGQIIDSDTLVSVQSWLPVGAVLGKFATHSDYKRTTASATSGVEISVVIAPVSGQAPGEHLVPAGGSSYDVIVSVAPLWQSPRKTS